MQQPFGQTYKIWGFSGPTRGHFPGSGQPALTTLLFQRATSFSAVAKDTSPPCQVLTMGPWAEQQQTPSHTLAAPWPAADSPCSSPLLSTLLCFFSFKLCSTKNVPTATSCFLPAAPVLLYDCYCTTGSMFISLRLVEITRPASLPCWLPLCRCLYPSSGIT